MHFTLCIIFFIFGIGTHIFASDFASPEYFPLNIGNTWTYKYWDIVSQGTPISRQIADTLRMNDLLYYDLRYISEDGGESSTYIRADSLNRICRYAEDGEQVWFDFSLPDSSHYSFIRDEGDTVNVLVRDNQTVETVLGDFYECKVFYFDNPDIYDDVVAYYIVKLVGIVRVRFSHWARELLAGYSFPQDSIIVSVEENPKINHKKSIQNFCNFPNPFNSSTTIHFQLEKGCTIQLNVYNIQGQFTKAILHEYKPAGNYAVQFDATDLPSGVYMLQLVAETDFIVRKIVNLQ